MKSVIAALALVASVGTANAQFYNQQSYGPDYMNSSRIGRQQYYNGQVGGQPFTGSSSSIGNQTYSTFNSGGHMTNCTSSRIGNQVYTNCY